ncbi:MAG: ABC transporter ATP-binding protein [Anaerolineae bacterium]
MNGISADVYVRVEQVYRSFGQGETAAHVLRGLDLTVHVGELVALYGPSGSGKTTLLNLIGALDRPNKGSIEVGGTDILKMGEGARARFRRTKIGFIFQNSTLLPTYTAYENIDLVLRLPGMGYFERRKRTNETLKQMGLTAWSNHVPSELSGGQQQRIAIARALALRPAMILADEPTSGLDTRTARGVMTLFREIAHTRGTTFLIVSHDPMITDFVDTAYDLNDGRLTIRHKAARQEHSTGAMTNGETKRSAEPQPEPAVDGGRDGGAGGL